MDEEDIFLSGRSRLNKREFLQKTGLAKPVHYGDKPLRRFRVSVTGLMLKIIRVIDKAGSHNWNISK